MTVIWKELEEKLPSVKDKLADLRKVRPQVDHLLQRLNEYGELILVGGAIRDFACERDPRDLDIIINSACSDFEDALLGFTYSRNRFGGYKVRAGDVECDIWGIHNNWAFREKIIETNVRNIAHGAFYNFDALVLNLDTDELDSHHFVSSLHKRELDILLNDDAARKNPTPEVNVVRAMVIHKTWELSFSERVRHYMMDWARTVDKPIAALKKAQKKHYGRMILSDHEMIALLHE